MDKRPFTSEYFINNLPPKEREFLRTPSVLDEISKYADVNVDIRGCLIRPGALGPDNSEKQLHLFISTRLMRNLTIATQKIQAMLKQFRENPAAGEDVEMDKVTVGIDVFPTIFRMKDKILGDKRENVDYFLNETGAAISLRGKGSGYHEEGGKESQEPLHVHIRHLIPQNKEKTRELVLNLIEVVQKDFQDSQYGQFYLPPKKPAVIPIPRRKKVVKKSPPKEEVPDNIEKITIGIESVPPTFNLKSKIYGPNLANVKHIEKVTNALLLVEGKGCDSSGKEHDEPPFILVKYLKPEMRDTARNLIFNLITTVQEEFATTYRQVPKKPEILPIKKPTLKDNDEPPPPGTTRKPSPVPPYSTSFVPRSTTSTRKSPPVAPRKSPSTYARKSPPVYDQKVTATYARVRKAVAAYAHKSPPPFTRKSPPPFARKSPPAFVRSRSPLSSVRKSPPLATRRPSPINRSRSPIPCGRRPSPINNNRPFSVRKPGPMRRSPPPFAPRSGQFSYRRSPPFIDKAPFASFRRSPPPRQPPHRSPPRTSFSRPKNAASNVTPVPPPPPVISKTVPPEKDRFDNVPPPAHLANTFRAKPTIKHPEPVPKPIPTVTPTASGGGKTMNRTGTTNVGVFNSVTEQSANRIPGLDIPLKAPPSNVPHPYQVIPPQPTPIHHSEYPPPVSHSHQYNKRSTSPVGNACPEAKKFCQTGATSVAKTSVTSSTGTAITIAGTKTPNSTTPKGKMNRCLVSVKTNNAVSTVPSPPSSAKPTKPIVPMPNTPWAKKIVNGLSNVSSDSEGEDTEVIMVDSEEEETVGEVAAENVEESTKKSIAVQTDDSLWQWQIKNIECACGRFQHVLTNVKSVHVQTIPKRGN